MNAREYFRKKREISISSLARREMGVKKFTRSAKKCIIQENVISDGGTYDRS